MAYDNDARSTLASLCSVSVGSRWRSSTTFVLIVVGFSLFTDFFLYGIIVPVLPFALKDRINLPEDEVQSKIGLLLAAEALASVLFSPIAGLIADFGNGRHAFLAGLLSLSFSTALLCFGRTLAALVIARVCQGISAAIVWTVGLSLVIDSVGSDRLGSVFGTIHSIVSVGTLASPSIGGIVYAQFGYYAVYEVSAALLITDLALRFIMIEPKRSQLTHSNDSAVTDERTPLLIDPVTGEEPPPPPSHTGFSKYFSLINILGDWHLLACLLVTLTQASLLASFDAILPLYLNSNFGFESSGSGLLFGILQLPYMIAGPFFGSWADRHGGRGCLILGTLAIAILAPLLSIPDQNALPLFTLILAGIGVGLSSIGGPAFVEANSIVRYHYEAHPKLFGFRQPYGQLYAINNVMYGLGMTIGPLVSVSLIESFDYRVAMFGLSALCLVTSSACLLGVNKKQLQVSHTE